MATATTVAPVVELPRTLPREITTHIKSGVGLGVGLVITPELERIAATRSQTRKLKSREGNLFIGQLYTLAEQGYTLAQALEKIPDEQLPEHMEVPEDFHKNFWGKVGKKNLSQSSYQVFEELLDENYVNKYLSGRAKRPALRKLNKLINSPRTDRKTMEQLQKHRDKMFIYELFGVKPRKGRYQGKAVAAYRSEYPSPGRLQMYRDVFHNAPKQIHGLSTPGKFGDLELELQRKKGAEIKGVENNSETFARLTFEWASFPELIPLHGEITPEGVEFVGGFLNPDNEDFNFVFLDCFMSRKQENLDTALKFIPHVTPSLYAVSYGRGRGLNQRKDFEQVLEQVIRERHPNVEVGHHRYKGTGGGLMGYTIARIT